MQITLPQFEALDGAHDALIRMGDFLTCADPRAWVRASNVLFDACLDAGMSHDEDDHQVWAVTTITNALVSA